MITIFDKKIKIVRKWNAFTEKERKTQREVLLLFLFLPRIFEQKGVERLVTTYL